MTKEKAKLEVKAPEEADPVVEVKPAEKSEAKPEKAKPGRIARMTAVVKKPTTWVAAAIALVVICIFTVTTVKSVKQRKQDTAKLVQLQKRIDEMQSREDRLRANFKVAKAAEEYDRASALLRNANLQQREKKEALAEADLLVKRLK